MATTRNATTHWEGTLFEGAGKVTLDSSGVGTFDVSWASRAEDANGKTSPEELIAAAVASCIVNCRVPATSLRFLRTTRRERVASLKEIGSRRRLLRHDLANGLSDG